MGSSKSTPAPQPYTLQSKQKFLQLVLQKLQQSDYNRRGPFKKRFPIAQFNTKYIHQCFMRIQGNCMTERGQSREQCHKYAQQYMDKNMDVMNQRFEEEVGIGLFTCLDTTRQEQKCVDQAVDKGNAIYRDFEKSIKGEARNKPGSMV